MVDEVNIDPFKINYLHLINDSTAVTSKKFERTRGYFRPWTYDKESPERRIILYVKPIIWIPQTKRIVNDRFHFKFLLEEFKPDNWVKLTKERETSLVQNVLNSSPDELKIEGPFSVPIEGYEGELPCAVRYNYRLKNRDEVVYSWRNRVISQL